MDELTRFAAATVLLVGTLLLGFAGQEVEQRASRTTYDSVQGLMQELPVQQQVRVTATVTAVDEDYEADSGAVYQQFYVSNGDREVLVFCDTDSGRAAVAVNDTVTVVGTFKQYYEQYEIFTDCGTGVRTG